MTQQPKKNSGDSAIFKALRFVADAHTGHYRKGTELPYMIHLMNVLKILHDYGASEDAQVAGLLHDAVEDTHVSIADVEAAFGPRVAALVAGASEESKLQGQESPWRDRKQHTLDYLAACTDPEILLVGCADKLDNARASLQDLRRYGPAFWSRFNQGAEQQEWYYRGLARVFREKGAEMGDPLIGMAAALGDVVEALFGEG